MILILAAFVTGLVALLTPCCVSMLLPAYLGSVFKHKSQILLMTLVYALGIATVVTPAVLGASLISQTLFRYHEWVYYLGGAMMVVAGFFALAEVKINFPKPVGLLKHNSIFLLGIFSGLSSACCAPVLIGLVSLGVVNPGWIPAIIAGLTYSLGLVTPLFLAGIFLNKTHIFDRELWTKPIGPFKLHSLIAGVLLIISGFIVMSLTISGKLSMDRSKSYAQYLQSIFLKLGGEKK